MLLWIDNEVDGRLDRGSEDKERSATSLVSRLDHSPPSYGAGTPCSHPSAKCIVAGRRPWRSTRVSSKRHGYETRKASVRCMSTQTVTAQSLGTSPALRGSAG